LKTSARNRLAGKVGAVQAGAVNDEVELTLAGGGKLVAVVTRGSSASLGLQVGVEAFALIKASSVILAVDTDDVRLSARNQLVGTVSRVTPGAVNAEVVLDLDGGESIAAVITLDSVKALGLAPGSKATALIKASNVLLGVPVARA